MLFSHQHLWNQVPLKLSSLTKFITTLYPKLYSLSCPLWPQSCANWTLINQSPMTKVAVVDNIVNVLKLLLSILSLKYKLRLSLQDQMSSKTTWQEICKPETSWLRNHNWEMSQRCHKTMSNPSFFVLPLWNIPNSKTTMKQIWGLSLTPLLGALH